MYWTCDKIGNFESKMTAICVEITELRPNNRFYTQMQELLHFYTKQFGQEPNFFVRVPGRVNIIGEHVDYCGYPVLPMAIDQCIILAVGCEEDNPLLQLRNIDSEKFENFDCDLNSISSANLESGSPKWYKYFLCGVKGIYEALGESVSHIGMKVAVSGNIPPAAGLSSSSALVSSAALATAHLYGMNMSRKNLASISANCERYIGTQGGGMDQAIAFLAKAGCAQFIEFHPELNATPIKLPEGACFVVANSLSEKNKAASSDFNERVVECRLGARLIAKEMNLSNWRSLSQFVQVQDALNCSLEALEKIASQCLSNNCFTRDEICQRLEVEEQDLEKEFLTPNTQHLTKFKVRQRTLHVIQESIRVRNFRTICESSGSELKENSMSNGKSERKTDMLSRLMQQSHSSLKELYECSHPDLDRLVEILDAAGVGARLTGAGWGGCVLALCDSAEKSVQCIHELKEKYFRQLPVHILEKHLKNDFNDAVFATCPQEGAEIYNLYK